MARKYRYRDRRQYCKQYYRDHSEKIKKRGKQYREDHDKELTQWHKQYSKTHSVEKKKYNKQYQKDHAEELSQKKTQYVKLRKQKDPGYKLSYNLRSRLNYALKSNYKVGSAVKDLGCSITDFKQYVEGKFQESMTWDNYGKYGWHLDHIIPLAKFNLQDFQQFRIACHYTNYQPLWRNDNIAKGDFSVLDYRDGMF